MKYQVYLNKKATSFIEAMAQHDNMKANSKIKQLIEQIVDLMEESLKSADKIANGKELQ